MADLVETRPIEVRPDGKLVMKIWAQDGTMVDLCCANTMHNRSFIVWLRKFDRRGPESNESNEGDKK
jgi:hypothetical protein